MVETLNSFSEADRGRIRGALDRARAATAAKLEFVAVPASDHYALVAIVWAAVVALVTTGILSLVRPHLGIGTGFVANAILFVVLSVVFDWWPVRVRLAPRPAKRAAASRMAHREFATRLMSRDDAHNGVMIFVSLAERHIEIVAEREAHAMIAAEAWNRIVAEATAKMRAGEVADGLVHAIDACGAALSAVFPARMSS